MSLVVQKFGGTSVANIKCIKYVAKIIRKHVMLGEKLSVVVSAMAGVTNQLVSLCSEVSSLNNQNSLAEYDAALSTGEMVTSSLLALELQNLGLNARSIYAWQLPILTNQSHSKALVEKIDNTLLFECINHNIIPIIAGFQGVTSKDNRYSTLGRGGSDTTASLIAASLKADRCDIFTDVDGVFTADPRVVSNAKKIDTINTYQMLELASSGAKVLHPRCIEIALRYNIKLRVLSTFDLEGSGTVISSMVMENKLVTGITFNRNLLKIKIKQGKLSFTEICKKLSIANINAEIMIPDLSEIIVPLGDSAIAQEVLREMESNSEIKGFELDSGISFISIVGYGLKNDASLLSNILTCLENEKIDINFIQSSEIKILLLVRDHDVDKAVKALHTLCI
jgi:aspartate kinase